MCDGNAYEVRPPTVREALILIIAGRRAIEGDDDAFNLVLFALKSWYPDQVYSHARAEAKRDGMMSRQLIIGHAFQLMHQGSPETRKRSEEAADDPESIEWGVILSRYMNTYSCSIQTVMDEPWPSFLHLSLRLGSFNAIYTMNTIRAISMAFGSKGKQRDKMFSELEEQLGIRSKPKKLTPEEQKSNLQEFALQFASIGALGKA